MYMCWKPLWRHVPDHEVECNLQNEQGCSLRGHCNLAMWHGGSEVKWGPVTGNTWKKKVGGSINVVKTKQNATNSTRTRIPLGGARRSSTYIFVIEVIWRSVGVVQCI